MGHNNNNMVKVYRTIRISDKLVATCEKILDTKLANDLGLETVKDVVEYYARKGIESNK